MKALRQILSFIFTHPLTRDHKLSAVWRFLKWQWVSRTFPYPFIYPFVNDSKLIIRKGMSGATGNLYAGLHEFEDMAFLLHLLREGDFFGDIGANIGSYTVLASAVTHARTITVEPIPSTFQSLKHNVAINDIENLVQLRNCGVGSVNGKLSFTKNFDTINHVVTPSMIREYDTVEVDVTTLDQLFEGLSPALLKIDVEGFELEVLKGGRQLLSGSGLKAIMIELNGLCHSFGVREEDIHGLLLSYGFSPHEYLPFERKLISKDSFSGSGNTLYIRDKSWIEQRIEGAPKFSVLNRAI